MKILQSHTGNPWSQGKKHNDGHGVTGEDNTNKRIADNLSRMSEKQEQFGG